MTALALVTLGVIAAANASPRDTIGRPTATFRMSHTLLLRSFQGAVQRALALEATRYDRASLVLWLRTELLPHARSEELILYPAVDKALGTKGYATATMVLDHKVIARVVDELARLAGAPDPVAFTQRAYALDALVTTHFDKEEQFILPILEERLREPELRALFLQMEQHTTL